MPLSLYDATIPSYLQILTAVLGLIDKAEAFCAEKGIAEQALLAEHFGSDMPRSPTSSNGYRRTPSARSRPCASAVSCRIGPPRRKTLPGSASLSAPA
ncbi:DUF1993 family protein [Sphingopyxis sp.]|uniref:DUF1993 family protein n=1 Tax=Sphingopyxis sp. TaxID=1908224 RepID=UPI0025F35595|nr:DUF1993 family protein [Sphingopyxis sp.]